MKKIALFLTIPILLFLSGCKKIVHDTVVDLFKSPNELPAITQSGKHTFGFLLNGKVWIPQGGIWTNKLNLIYDEDANGGIITINARQQISNENDSFLRIGITAVTKTGTYAFQLPQRNIYYRNSESKCEYDESSILSGSMTITRLDLQTGIISGTFEFKLKKEGCPDINATEGRFDLTIQ
jgi:hypothetical protein